MKTSVLWTEQVNKVRAEGRILVTSDNSLVRQWEVCTEVEENTLFYNSTEHFYTTFVGSHTLEDILLHLCHLLDCLHSSWQRVQVNEEVLWLPDTDGFFLEFKNKTQTWLMHTHAHVRIDLNKTLLSNTIKVGTDGNAWTPSSMKKMYQICACEMVTTCDVTCAFSIHTLVRYWTLMFFTIFKALRKQV